MAAAYTIGYDNGEKRIFAHSGGQGWETNSGSYTCGDSGGNTFLILEIYGSSVYYNHPELVSLTYDGIPFTYSGIRVGDGYSLWVHVYYIANAPSGAHTLQTNLLMSGDSGADIIVRSYTGVSKLNPFDSYGTNGAYHTSPPTLTDIYVSTTVVKNNCWLLGCYMHYPAGTDQPNSDKTDRFKGAPAYLGARYCSSDTNGTVSTGSQDIAFHHTNTWPMYCGGVVYSLAPATPAEEYDTIIVGEDIAIIKYQAPPEIPPEEITVGEWSDVVIVCLVSEEEEVHLLEWKDILIPILLIVENDSIVVSYSFEKERIAYRHLQIETNIYQPRASL